MLVLTAPTSDDPRDGGFNHALPGELLYRPFACDAGIGGDCGCSRSWVGVSSSKRTTLAQVAELDTTPHEYIATIGTFLMDAWQFSTQDAYDEARLLADMAADYEPGSLLTIKVDGDQHLIELLETEHG